MKKLSVLLILLCVPFLTTASIAKLPDSWEKIINNPKYVKSPTREDVFKRAIAPSGDYQLFPVGDRFVFLFDPSGYPIVTFDLTIEPNSWKRMILGSIGIGEWSVRGLWRKYKATKENPNELLNLENPIPEGSSIDQIESDERAYQKEYDEVDEKERKYGKRSDIEKDKERGYKEFAKIKFKEKFVQANKASQVDSIEVSRDKNTGFKPLSFNLSDLYITERQQDKLLPAMSQYSELMFGYELTEENLPEFMNQFRMYWNQDKEEFTMAFEPIKVGDPKKPVLPGWVLNYQNPLDILAFKYSMRRIEGMIVNFEYIFPQWWHLVGIFASRMNMGIKSQLDSHEAMLQELFESASRGETALNLPLENPDQFINESITMLYLNKMIDTKDVTDGWEKRQKVAAEEAKVRKTNFEILRKKKYEINAWPGNRIATVERDGERKGILNLVMKKFLFARIPSFHYYDAAPWYKSTQRLGLEIFTAAVRMFLPGRFIYRQGNFSIGIALPSGVWDRWFRGRSYTEIMYEGHIIAKISERLAGRIEGGIPGYSDDELKDMQATFYRQRNNPYEIQFKQEKDAKLAHWKLIKDFLGQGQLVELKR